MNLELLSNLMLLIMSWFVLFGIGYLMGCWKIADQYDKHLADVVINYEEEIKSIRKKAGEDGEGWKL